MLLKSLNLVGGWRYDIFSPESDPHEFGAFAEIKAIWDRRRAHNRLPAWSDFEFGDWDGWHGWLAIEDVLCPAPYDSVFRLWGTKWTDVYGADFTGRRYCDTDGAFVENEILALWEETCETHNIIVSEGVMDWLDQNSRLFGQTYHDIVLPMGNDGNRVDKFLMVMAPGPNAIWRKRSRLLPGTQK